MLQFRPGQGNPGQGAFYAPGRDVLYTLPNVIMEALKGIEQRDSDVTDFLNTFAVGDAELECAAISLAKFLGSAIDKPDFIECLNASGLDNCETSALGIVGARVLLILLKQFHLGVLESTVKGEEPPIPITTYKDEFTKVINNWRWNKPTKFGYVVNFLMSKFLNFITSIYQGYTIFIKKIKDAKSRT